MALQGDLQTLPAHDLLGLLARRRASGQLSLSRGMTACRFHLSEGRVMLASSTEEQNLLGRMLVEQGLVDELELARVIKARGKGAQLRLGKALTEAGLVSPRALAKVLSEKIERLLGDALAWTDGTFYFDEETVSRTEVAVATSVDLEALLATRPAGPPANDTVVISDADVIEAQPIEPPPRRRATTPPSSLSGKRNKPRGRRGPAAA